MIKPDLPNQFDVLFDQIGFHVTLNTLPMDWINVLNTPKNKNKIKDLLNEMFYSSEIQEQMKQLDYQSKWESL